MQINMKWVLGVPTVVAVLGSLAYFGLDFSGFRPAWSYEHNALAQIVYDNECDKWDGKLYRAIESKNRYIQEGMPVPQDILDSIAFYKRKLKEFNCPV